MPGNNHHQMVGGRASSELHSGTPLNSLRHLSSRNNFTSRDGVLEVGQIKRIKAPCGGVSLGIHVEREFGSSGARQHYVMREIVGQPVSFPGAQ